MPIIFIIVYWFSLVKNRIDGVLIFSVRLWNTLSFWGLLYTGFGDWILIIDHVLSALNLSWLKPINIEIYVMHMVVRVILGDLVIWNLYWWCFRKDFCSWLRVISVLFDCTGGSLEFVNADRPLHFWLIDDLFDFKGLGVCSIHVFLYFVVLSCEPKRSRSFIDNSLGNGSLLFFIFVHFLEEIGFCFES